MHDWFSTLLKALRHVPLVLVVIGMFPTWLSWIYLSDARQASALKMVRELRQWAAGESKPPEEPDGNNAIEPPPDNSEHGGSDV